MEMILVSFLSSGAKKMWLKVAPNDLLNARYIRFIFRSSFILQISHGKVSAIGKSGHEINLTHEIQNIEDYLLWQVSMQHRVILPWGGQYRVFLPSGGQDRVILPSGGQHGVILPSGGQHKVILPSGGQDSVILPSGGQHGVILPSGGQHRVILPSGGQDRVIIPWGASMELSYPEGVSIEHRPRCPQPKWTPVFW